MYKNQHKTFGIILIIIDSLISAFSITIAGILRYGSIAAYFNATEVPGLIMVTLSSGIVVFHFSKMFGRFFVRGYLREMVHVLWYTTMLLLLITLYTFFTRNQMMLSRLTLLYFFGINLVLMNIAHLLIKKARAMHKQGYKGNRTLIISDAESAEETCRNIANSFWIDDVYALIILDDQSIDSDKLYGIPQIVPDLECADYIRDNAIDEVLVSVSENRYKTDRMKSLIDEIVDTGMIVSIRGWIAVNESAPVFRLKGFNDFYVITFANREYDYFPIILKRAMDLLGAVIGILIMGIVGLFVAPAILIESPGPVFFRQKRIGRNGRVFTMLKFRSMCNDAEKRKAELMEKNKMKGPLFKIDDDCRITKVGKFIRKTSLDELPQFINVLKGDMSLIGTRPPTLDEYKQYTCAQKKRLCFRPGISGIWQVSGRNNITDFNEVMQMDLQYIRDWSIYLDIKLILKTVLAVLFGKGAV